MYCLDCDTSKNDIVDDEEDGIVIRYWYCAICGEELWHEVIDII